MAESVIKAKTRQSTSITSLPFTAPYCGLVKIRAQLIGTNTGDMYLLVNGTIVDRIAQRTALSNANAYSTEFMLLTVVNKGDVITFSTSSDLGSYAAFSNGVLYSL